MARSESPRFSSLLDEIGRLESGNRPNVAYGGNEFTGPAHPNQKVVIETGPNEGKYSTAAGEFQFLSSTWNEYKDKLGLTDFSPENQRLAAAELARDRYKRETGRDLDEDVESDDPTIQSGILTALNRTWTSLPGGIEEQKNSNVLANIFSAPVGSPVAELFPPSEDPTPAGSAAVESGRPVSPVAAFLGGQETQLEQMKSPGGLLQTTFAQVQAASAGLTDPSGAPVFTEPYTRIAPSTAKGKFKQAAQGGALQLGADVQQFGAVYNFLTGDEKAAQYRLRKAEMLSEASGELLSNLGTFEDFVEEPTVGGLFDQILKAVGQFTPMAISSLASGFSGFAIQLLGKGTLSLASRKVTKEVMSEIVRKHALATGGRGPALSRSEQRILDAAYDVARKARVGQGELFGPSPSSLIAAGTRASGKGASLQYGFWAGAGAQEYVVGTAQSLAEFGDAGLELTAREAKLAALMGVPQTAIGLFSEKIFFSDVAKRVIGKYDKAIKRGATKQAEEYAGWLREIAQGLGGGFIKGGGTELGSELAQEELFIQQRLAIDPEYSQREVNLRRAESAFAGFFAGGAARAPASAVGNVIGKARAYTKDEFDRRSEVAAEVQDTPLGAVVSEPASWAAGQAEGLLDPGTGVRAVWLPGGTEEEARSALTRAGEDRPDLATKDVQIVEAPDGRGVLIFDPASDPAIAQMAVETDFSEGFLADVLGYTQTQDPGDTHVVQVRDAGGRVVWSQSTTDENIEATQARARQLFPDTQRYSDPEVKFKVDAVRERWQAQQEEAPGQTGFDFGEQEQAERDAKPVGRARDYEVGGDSPEAVVLNKDIEEARKAWSEVNEALQAYIFDHGPELEKARSAEAEKIARGEATTDTALADLMAKEESARDRLKEAENASDEYTADRARRAATAGTADDRPPRPTPYYEDEGIEGISPEDLADIDSRADTIAFGYDAEVMESAIRQKFGDEAGDRFNRRVQERIDAEVQARLDARQPPTQAEPETARREQELNSLGFTMQDFMEARANATIDFEAESPRHREGTESSRGRVGQHRWARRDSRTGIIYINEKILRQKFDDKAWTKPLVKGVRPLPENAFSTLEEFTEFIILHEVGHGLVAPVGEPSDGRPQFNDSYAAHENRINDGALLVLAEQASQEVIVRGMADESSLPLGIIEPAEMAEGAEGAEGVEGADVLTIVDAPEEGFVRRKVTVAEQDKKKSEAAVIAAQRDQPVMTWPPKAPDEILQKLGENATSEEINAEFDRRKGLEKDFLEYNGIEYDQVEESDAIRRLLDSLPTKFLEDFKAQASLNPSHTLTPQLNEDGNWVIATSPNDLLGGTSGTEINIPERLERQVMKASRAAPEKRNQTPGWSVRDPDGTVRKVYMHTLVRLGMDIIRDTDSREFPASLLEGGSIVEGFARVHAALVENGYELLYREEPITEPEIAFSTLEPSPTSPRRPQQLSLWSRQGDVTESRRVAAWKDANIYDLGRGNLVSFNTAQQERGIQKPGTPDDAALRQELAEIEAKHDAILQDAADAYRQENNGNLQGFYPPDYLDETEVARKRAIERQLEIGKEDPAEADLRIGGGEAQLTRPRKRVVTQELLDESERRVAQLRATATQAVEPSEAVEPSDRALFQQGAFSDLSPRFDEFAQVIRENELTKRTSGRDVIWFGAVDYEYTGARHQAQDMPDVFSDLARRLEARLNYPEGYFNSVLINLYPRGKGIGAHADDEAVFLRRNKTIGAVATINLGGASEVTLTNKQTRKKATRTVNDGDLYVMPDGTFQAENLHAVGPANAPRISMTFRHVPSSVLEQQGIQPTQQQEAAPTTIEAATLHSGGAVGADTVWGMIGKQYGMLLENIKHYWIEGGSKPPQGNVLLTDAQKAEARPHVQRAAASMRERGDTTRSAPSKLSSISLIHRNWFQVKNSDAVFAIIRGGFNPTRTLIDTKTDRGTPWAVEMGINEGKPVYVFSQKLGQWFTWDGSKFTETETPTLTPNFAGIGTRGINEAGRQAIRDVYEKAAREGTAAPTAAQPAATEAGPPLNIWAGTNENAELSNLAVRPFRSTPGRQYQSVEHAYQSLKSGAFDETVYNNPRWGKGPVKIVGQEGTKTEANWNIRLMERLMRASFEQNPEAQQALLATGNAALTHTQDRGVWRTKFPELLTSIRDFYSEAQPTAGPRAEAQASTLAERGYEVGDTILGTEEILVREDETFRDVQPRRPVGQVEDKADRIPLSYLELRRDSQRSDYWGSIAEAGARQSNRRSIRGRAIVDIGWTSVIRDLWPQLKEVLDGLLGYDDRTVHVITAQQILAEGYNVKSASPSTQERIQTDVQQMQDDGKLGLYFRYGDTDLIVIDVPPDASAEQQAKAILTLGHEIGHAIFYQELERSLNNPKLRKDLITEWEADRNAGVSESYYGEAGFEEWFADKLGAWLLRGPRRGHHGFEEYRDTGFGRHRIWKDKPKNAVDSFFKRLADKIIKVFNSLDQALKRRFRRNESFDTYIQDVIKTYSEGRDRNLKLPFETAVQVRNMVDETLSTYEKFMPRRALQQIKRLALNSLKAGSDLLPNDRRHWSVSFFLLPAHNVVKAISSEIAKVLYSMSQSQEKEGYLNARGRLIYTRLSTLWEMAPTKVNVFGARVPDLDAFESILREAEDDRVPTSQLSPEARQVRQYLDDFYENYIRGVDEDVPKRANFYPRILALYELQASPELQARLVELLEEFNPEGPDDIVVYNSKGEEISRTPGSFDKIVGALIRERQDNMDNTHAEVGDVAIGTSEARAKYFKAIPNARLRELKDSEGREVLEAAGTSIRRYVEDMTKRLEYLNHVQTTMTREDLHNLNTVGLDLQKAFNNIKVGSQVRGWRAMELMLLRIPDEVKRNEARDAVKAMIGKSGLGMSNAMRNINSVFLTINIITYLTFATLASLGDFAGPILRSKELSKENFKTAFGQLRRYFTDAEEMKQFSRDIGVVSFGSLNTSIMQASELGHITPAAQKVSDVFFQAIGLEWFTNFTRVFSAGMGEQFLIRQANINSEKSTRWLQELGVSREDVSYWDANGRSFESPQGERVQLAIGRFVEESIVRPNAAERPVWASNPYTAVVWQLKSFFYAYGKNIIGGAMRETKNRYAEDGTISSASIPLVLGAVTILPLTMLGLEIREWVKYVGRGFDEKAFRSDTMDWSTYTGDIIDRAGPLGPYGLVLPMLEAGEFGRSWWVPPLGPSAERIEDLVRGNAKLIDYVPGAAAIY